MEIQSKKRANLVSTEGLLGHLADIMIGVEKGLIDIEQAKAQVALVSTARNLLKDQFEVMKYLGKKPATQPIDIIGEDIQAKNGAPKIEPPSELSDEELDEGKELALYEETKKKIIDDSKYFDAT